jgi:hypothetical protein
VVSPAADGTAAAFAAAVHVGEHHEYAADCERRRRRRRRTITILTTTRPPWLLFMAGAEEAAAPVAGLRSNGRKRLSLCRTLLPQRSLSKRGWQGWPLLG